MGTIEGDIFDESNEGTFLTSLDTESNPSLFMHGCGLIYKNHS
jgi:hypothetical protein